MKISTLLLLIFFRIDSIHAQTNLNISDTVQTSYFRTNSMKELKEKFAELPCGISVKDSMNVMINKLENYLKRYAPTPKYNDDKYAVASCLQALKGIKEGGYGIGAVLIDDNGDIIASAYNSQIQLNRSDLHGEMTLLTNFESSDKAKYYMNGYVYKKGITVFSSLEPCPIEQICKTNRRTKEKLPLFIKKVF